MANLLAQARAYLEANQWDISSAAAEYFTSLEEAEDPSAQPPQPASNPTPDTSRQAKIDPTLQPIPVTSSLPSARASASKPQPKKKFATLGDLSGGGGSSHAGHGHDDESDDDEEEDQDFFAGGEKSALAVQNPDEIKRKILERARRLDFSQSGSKSAITEDNTGTLQGPAEMIQLHQGHTLREPPRHSAETIPLAESSRILIRPHHGIPRLFNVSCTFGMMASRLMMVRFTVQTIQPMLRPSVASEPVRLR